LYAGRAMSNDTLQTAVAESREQKEAGKQKARK
jgi:hypothetical protein